MPRNEDDGASPTKLLDSAALARELGISPWLLGELRRRGTLPKPIRLGGLVRWRATAIEAWLSKLARAPFQPRSLRGVIKQQAERRTGRIERERLERAPPRAPATEAQMKAWLAGAKVTHAEPVPPVVVPIKVTTSPGVTIRSAFHLVETPGDVTHAKPVPPKIHRERLDPADLKRLARGEGRP